MLQSCVQVRHSYVRSDWGTVMQESRAILAHHLLTQAGPITARLSLSQAKATRTSSNYCRVSDERMGEGLSINAWCSEQGPGNAVPVESSSSWKVSHIWLYCESQTNGPSGFAVDHAVSESVPDAWKPMQTARSSLSKWVNCLWRPLSRGGRSYSLLLPLCFFCSTSPTLRSSVLLMIKTGVQWRRTSQAALPGQT
ncbi:hypothetical protein EJ04DRAFT_109955 [Polyplosphaeria fusca]|uniref:Uncharacterized protein n=1 Tax=Polyplosphaeria fusca TaxID=682080 RepID=A0A9P4UVF1_9PLEO|nr:hypothetical protein EJ04DRAFT_109955 [Polyplosphaeria fusca]